MTEHIALLEKEIRQLEINLERAVSRPGVTQGEIQNLEKKIRLKSDVVDLLCRKRKHSLYSVFWRLHPNEFEPNPGWIQYDGWSSDVDLTKSELERARKNPRCAEAKIVSRSEFYEDYGGSGYGCKL